MSKPDDSNSTNAHWWSLNQACVWIALRIETSARDAEQIANHPDLTLDIEQALNRLANKLIAAALAPSGMPIHKARIKDGRHYVDLVSLIRPPLSESPGAWDAAMHEYQKLIRESGAEYYSLWIKREFPLPAPAVDATAPMAAAPAPSVPDVQSETAPPTEHEAASSHAMPTEPPSELTVASSIIAEDTPQPPEIVTEQLTYAQLVDRLGCPSVDAARTLVARRGLPRASGSDGKTRVTINLQQICYQPRSTRSPGGRRPVAEPASTRSPDDDRPVAEGEASSPLPADAMTAATATPPATHRNESTPAQSAPEQSEPVPPATEPGIADPASAASAAPPVNRGGRPTDRDMVRGEAGWRLRHQQAPETLAAFGRELREWLRVHGRHRAVKTGEVMKAETIEDHVRLLWNAHKRA
jgi:hypothetical protein